MKDQNLGLWLLNRNSFPVLFLFILFGVEAILLFVSGLIQ
jgi:hypothetical protein